MKAIRIDQPKIAFDYSLEPLEAIEPGVDYEYVESQNAEITSMVLRSVGFDGCRIINTLALNLKLETSQFLDSWIRGGDWSAAEFIDCGLRRISIDAVRASGLSLAGCSLKSVQFSGCKLDFANFRQASLANVSFFDCELDQADFSGANLTNVAFTKCNLSGADFSGGSYNNVDLRTSQLTSIKGVATLAGVTVDTTQLVGLLPQLALELGIEVED